MKSLKAPTGRPKFSNPMAAASSALSSGGIVLRCGVRRVSWRLQLRGALNGSSFRILDVFSAQVLEAFHSRARACLNDFWGGVLVRCWSTSPKLSTIP